MRLATSRLDRHLLFREDFTSVKSVTDSLGTITSAPVIDHGASFDGTDDKIAYPAVRGVKSVSFWITLATATEDIMELSASHSIEAVSGTLTATGVSSPTFYVNGVATAAIGTGRVHVTVTTATAFDADAFAVGADDTYGEFRIEDLQLHSVTLTAEEAKDFFERDTYSEIERPIVDLPLRSWYYDGSSVAVTENKGSLGGTATLGDGSTTTTFPTQLSPHGDSFDNGDYLSLGNNDSLNIGTGSMSVCALLDTAQTGSTRFITGKLSSPALNEAVGYSLYLGDSGSNWKFLVASGSGVYAINTSSKVSVGKKTVLISTFDYATKTAKLYVDGILESTDTNGSLGSSDNSDNLLVGGAEPSDVYRWLGNIYAEKIYKKCLTPIQVRKVTKDFLNRLNV